MRKRKRDWFFSWNVLHIFLYMINFDENCNKGRESRRERAIDRKKSRKMRPGNQYALCLGAQLNGRGSLPAIFFDQRLLGFFSLIPWGVTGWFCGLKGPPETNAIVYALSFLRATRLSLKKSDSSFISFFRLFSLSLRVFVSLKQSTFFTDEPVTCPFVGNDSLRTSTVVIKTKNTTCGTCLCNP